MSKWMLKVGLVLAGVVAILAAGHTRAYAGYPMVSDLSNQIINSNDATPVIKFTVSDDRTQASDLVVTYRSSNRDLVPQSDDNIILGGSGSERRVQVVPAPNKSGIAIISIIVTDTDSESNVDTFEVEVIRPVS